MFSSLFEIQFRRQVVVILNPSIGLGLMREKTVYSSPEYNDLRKFHSLGLSCGIGMGLEHSFVRYPQLTIGFIPEISFFQSGHGRLDSYNPRYMSGKNLYRALNFHVRWSLIGPIP